MLRHFRAVVSKLFFWWANFYLLVHVAGQHVWLDYHSQLGEGWVQVKIPQPRLQKFITNNHSIQIFYHQLFVLVVHQLFALVDHYRCVWQKIGKIGFQKIQYLLYLATLHGHSKPYYFAISLFVGFCFQHEQKRIQLHQV